MTPDVKTKVQIELDELEDDKLLVVAECLKTLKATEEFDILLDFYFTDELIRLNDLANSSATRFSEYADVHKESIRNSMVAIAEFKEFINTIPQRVSQIEQKIADKRAFLERK